MDERTEQATVTATKGNTKYSRISLLGTVPKIMRWRSSGSETSTAASAVPLDTKELIEAEATHEAASASTSASTASSAISSPLAGQEDDAADSSLSEAAMIQNARTRGSQQQLGSATMSRAQDPTTATGSTIEPDGDPPYKPPLSSKGRVVKSASDGIEGEDGAHPTDSASNQILSSSEESRNTMSSHGSTGTSPLRSTDSPPSLDDAGDDQEVPWKPQATQSTCEFTHTIVNYSQKRDSGCKKAEYSATTVDEFGNRWRLIVYVNGNGRASNHHLSLFLQVADADDLPFGWKKAVSYVLTLEHPTGPNLSYAKRNPDKTFKLCPKAIDWGWSQFITSDRIQQEGFVQEDSLVVRASVTVKNSSVSIDLEDAELYLKCAVEEGKPEAVQLCLDQGAKVNCQFKDDLYTPLHTACSSSTVDDDEEDDDADASANEAGSIGVDAEKKRREKISDSMRVLQLLLEKGADGNACNKWKETPLLIAANNGHRSAVEALLNHGADPSLCSEAGWSALTFAAHKGYDDIVDLLLNAGAPVNCRVTEDASTPLHKACAGSKSGHLAAVKLLLSNQADVHALNKWRETPLLTAANHGQDGAVDALLKAGADPCKCTDTGWSPLSIAAYKGHDDVVQLLLEEGAPTEEADPTLSALLQAATKGLPETVQLLLKHGADHTVTTKKGDTALSILVEQNLIDAAVDMVTEYNASIPRCSRDRKKVQRARLLINLRVKQRQREGKNIRLVDSDEDENVSEQEDTEKADSINLSQHNSIGEGSENRRRGKTNKKKKKKKMTAEQQAKAAEEALLLELEQEDAERQKQEQEASKKSAKKRKKKERERQQKKEQEEKRLAEEKEREESQRREREEKEARDRAERGRLLAIKRKEEEEERKRHLERQKKEQHLREEQRKRELQKKKELQIEKRPNSADGKTIPLSTEQSKRHPLPASRARSRPEGKASRIAPAKPIGKPQNAQPMTAAATIPRSSSKNRGWETKPVANGTSDESKKRIPNPIGGNMNPQSATAQLSSLDPLPQERLTGIELFSSSTSNPFAAVGGELLKPSTSQRPSIYTNSEQILNGFPTPAFPGRSGVETPAVAIFRQEKVSELLKRFAVSPSTPDALAVVDDRTLRKVWYRWMVRSAHESTPTLDCIIPSWTDKDKLIVFFQRQFISESRRGVDNQGSSAVLSMEALREAGSSVALLCLSFAKEVSEYRQHIEGQLVPDWTDVNMDMKASEVVPTGSHSSTSVVLSWANRAQVYLSALVFNKLRGRFVGPPSRFLSTLFSARIRYDTRNLLTIGLSMDFDLPAETKSTLSMKCNVNAEVWSDPFSALSGSVFWGQFEDIDAAFGGVAPFGKGDSDKELLARHGGAVCVTVPLDSMVASHYLQRMLDILIAAEKGIVPISFYVFMRSDCFLDGKTNPSLEDLRVLDSTLNDRHNLIVHVEELGPGLHSFYREETKKLEKSPTGSIFLALQNAPARSRFGLHEEAIAEVLRSLGAMPRTSASTTDPLPMMSEMSFSAPEFVPAANRNKDFLIAGGSSGLFGHSQPLASVSPLDHTNILSDFRAHTPGDFAGFAGSRLGAFPSSVAPATRSSRPARGRLFDLVDDGVDDDQGAADVVTGMLGNLDMDDIFSQQTSVGTANGGEVDIEAISSMGISGPPQSGGRLEARSRRFG